MNSQGFSSEGDSFSFKQSEIPVFELDNGIRYDFHNGLRIMIPKEGRACKIMFQDVDSGTTLFGPEVCKPGSLIHCTKSYYIRYSCKITDAETDEVLWDYTLDLKGKDVMIIMPVPTIGDTMAWFPYVELFRQKHMCNMICVMQPKFIELFSSQYSNIQFVTIEEAREMKPFAEFMLGLWWHDDVSHQPVDHRLVGLHKTAAYILGLDTEKEYMPRLDLSVPRKIREPYVCIAVQSTTMSKNWRNPTGWIELVQFLKDSGYRVLCIDRDKVQSHDGISNSIPWGCEDFTGNIPLQERINLLKDADFFVGLPSGLSWLAWACFTPVVLIGGFSLPYTEFYTPYRVTNYHACVGCWNDVRFDFDHKDWMWCPRHKDTPKQHECTRLISVLQVINTIKTIPIFKARQNDRRIHA